jgi:HlyD family secretion protein
MTWTKRIIAAVFILAIAGLVYSSLKPRKEKPTEVQFATVKKGSITRRVTASGKLQPATQVKVSSNLSGDLLELAVQEGEVVKKGQLLARIDSRRYLAQVRQQEALKASAGAELSLSEVELGRARLERDRVKRLVASNAASQAELDRADAEVAAQEARGRAVQERIAQAAAALSEAQHFLSLTTLYAPIDGVVTSKLKQVGERVRGSDFAEDVLLVISTLNSMEIKVEVGEQEVVHLHEADKGEVEVDAFPDKKFPATVVEIAKNATIKNPGTEAEVTTFPVRLALDTPIPGALPGMSGDASVATETHSDAVLVPIQAVTARSEKELAGDKPEPAPEAQTAATVKKPARSAMVKVVFVRDGEVARLRRVETGLASDSDVEIVSGLKEGEVVVEGPYKALSKELSDGKPVKLADPKKKDGKEKS